MVKYLQKHVIQPVDQPSRSRIFMFVLDFFSYYRFRNFSSIKLPRQGRLIEMQVKIRTEKKDKRIDTMFFVLHTILF